MRAGCRADAATDLPPLLRSAHRLRLWPQLHRFRLDRRPETASLGSAVLCFEFALGRPVGLPDPVTPAALRRLLKGLGWSLAASWEPGRRGQWLAAYWDDVQHYGYRSRVVHHLARHRAGRVWVSKLGKDRVIEHRLLDLCGPAYGERLDFYWQPAVD
ncbi:MAG: hypothetical protein IT204_08785 [Fimbriimonadaceae bacterium]|nr:hypothetical protein [Fimbriimonadaceae bacterium]